jgi:hypothetical protein
MTTNPVTNSVDFIDRGVVIDSVPFKKGNTKDKDSQQLKPEDLRANWQIPDDETLERCIGEAKKLQKNHPAWTPEKAARKVAEKFALKAL